MRRHPGLALVLFTAFICLLPAARTEAVTTIINRNVEQDTTNRPFFNPADYPAESGIVNDNGYSGTATSGVHSSTTVTGVNLGIGGNNTNGIPMGVVVNFGAQFTIDTTNSGHLLADTGNTGLAVNSSSVRTDPNPAGFSAGETLFVSDVQLTGLSILDPIGLLQPGTTVSARWRVLRSAGTTFNQTADALTTSTDPGGTENVQTFTQGQINNSFNVGLLNPPKTPLYMTTTGGDWVMKGIGYEVEITYELADPPATRRTFNFGTNFHANYTGSTSHQLPANGDSDTIISLSAIGNEGVLDVNNLGVGVNSVEDDELGAFEQRLTNGTLPTPEFLYFSFNRDVSLESLTLGNLEVNDTEGVVLSFVSGTNPFTGLTGYTGEYTLGDTSLTYIGTLGLSQSPFPVAYGKDGQDPIIIEAGTVMSLTANPQNGSGFLLDMMTVHVLSEPTPDGDFNDDGKVDAADYVLWRKDSISGNEGYHAWRSTFGTGTEFKTTTAQSAVV